MSTAVWTTLSVTRTTGWTNLYTLESAYGGVIARPAPATLLQQNDDGHRRVVFATNVGAELVPADRWPGYLSTVPKGDWEVAHGLGRIDLLVARETGGPM
jgi:hypothetical protein